MRGFQKLRFECDGGWARAKGAEGKIKGGGVTPMLKHCLHIGFGNSTPKGLGVTVFALFLAMLGKSEGATLYEAYGMSRKTNDFVSYNFIIDLLCF